MLKVLRIGFEPMMGDKPSVRLKGGCLRPNLANGAFSVSDTTSTYILSPQRTVF